MPFFPLTIRRAGASYAKVPRRDEEGSLSRTTLQFSEAGSPLAFGEAVDELKRVPGVLTAELDIHTDRAMVAHDSGVGASSLLAAASRGGIRVRVLKGPPPQTIGFDVMVGPFGAWSRFMLAFATAVFASTAITDILFSGDVRLLLPAFVVSLAVIFSIEAIVRRYRNR